MNPSTTGRHLPPYAQETPLGMFVLQEKKVKMVFLKDGSKETGGYAPYASRFTDGAYIHGVPVNAPGRLIEVLPGYRAEPLTLSLVYPQRRELSRRVNLFMQWLAGVMKEHLD